MCQGRGLPKQDAARIRQELTGQTAEKLVERIQQVDETIRRAIEEDTGTRAAKPRWDKEQRELWVGDQSVRPYRNKAPNQTIILESFETEDWPVRIDSPLSQEKDLYQTLWQLNHKIVPPVIRFKADGTGKGSFGSTQLNRPASKPKSLIASIRSLSG